MTPRSEELGHTDSHSRPALTVAIGVCTEKPGEKRWARPSKETQRERTRRERREYLFRETGFYEIPDGMKQCSQCRRLLAFEDFNKKSYTKSATESPYRSWCRRCEANCCRSFRKTKSGSEYHRNQRLLRRFGITATQYDEMLESQGGACAICGSSAGSKSRNMRLSVDHSHATGKVRGLLCLHCNVAIGKFGDSSAMLRKAATYLDRSQEVNNDAA